MLNSRKDWTPDLVCRIDPLGKEAVRTLIDRLKPDGIICANDFTAANLMKTLSALKVAVPQQIRLCGIDDVKYASLLSVPLTTVHQPCEKMGAEAVAAMIQRFGIGPARQRYPPGFSCSCPRVLRHEKLTTDSRCL
jgi:DNA-binding LacI/PurR family transcriptional regulator